MEVIYTSSGAVDSIEILEVLKLEGNTIKILMKVNGYRFKRISNSGFIDWTDLDSPYNESQAMPKEREQELESIFKAWLLQNRLDEQNINNVGLPPSEQSTQPKNENDLEAGGKLYEFAKYMNQWYDGDSQVNDGCLKNIVKDYLASSKSMSIDIGDAPFDSSNTNHQQ